MTTVILSYTPDDVRRLIRAADTEDIPRSDIKVYTGGIQVSDDLFAAFEADLIAFAEAPVPCNPIGPCASGPCIDGPTLASLTPAATNDAGTDLSITLTGTNFRPESRVFIDGVEQDGSLVTFVDDTELTLTVPVATLAGTYDIHVRNGSEESPVVRVLTIRPMITSLTPDTDATGDLPISVVIAGFGFGAGSVVKIDGTTDVTETIDSVTQITFTFPAHAAGVVPVTVERDGAVATAVNFTVTA